jgi:hypothetical protein
VLDVASAVESRMDEGSSSRAPIPTMKRKRKQVGVSKQWLGSADAPVQGGEGYRRCRHMGLGGPRLRVSLREVLRMSPSRPQERERTQSEEGSCQIVLDLGSSNPVGLAPYTGQFGAVLDCPPT